MTLKILDCSLNANMADTRISEHLCNQYRLDGNFERANAVWSTSSIRRFLLYRLPHVIGLILALWIIVFAGSEIGLLWDDTTRKQKKLSLAQKEHLKLAME